MKEIWRENTIQDLITSKEGIIKCRVVLNTHLHLSWGDSESCNFFPHHLPLEFCKVTPVWSPPSTQINETWQWDITDRLKCFEQILYEFRINLKWCEWYTFFCVCEQKENQIYCLELECKNGSLLFYMLFPACLFWEKDRAEYYSYLRLCPSLSAKHQKGKQNHIKWSMLAGMAAYQAWQAGGSGLLLSGRGPGASELSGESTIHLGPSCSDTNLSSSNRIARSSRQWRCLLLSTGTVGLQCSLLSAHHWIIFGITVSKDSKDWQDQSLKAFCTAANSTSWHCRRCYAPRGIIFELYKPCVFLWFDAQAAKIGNISPHLWRQHSGTGTATLGRHCKRREAGKCVSKQEDMYCHLGYTIYISGTSWLKSLSLLKVKLTERNSVGSDRQLLLRS